jgi:hypothetical protein
MSQAIEPVLINTADVVAKLYLILQDPLLTVNNVSIVNPSDPHIAFAGPSEVGMAMFRILHYLEKLKQFGLERIFEGNIRPPTFGEYEKLFSGFESLIVSNDWPTAFKIWLRHVAAKGQSFPNLLRLKMNNLRIILEPADLLSLKQVFPNLDELEYIRHGEEGDEYQYASITAEQLNVVFGDEKLEPFDL